MEEAQRRKEADPIPSYFLCWFDKKCLLVYIFPLYGSPNTFVVQGMLDHKNLAIIWTLKVNPKQPEKDPAVSGIELVVVVPMTYCDITCGSRHETFAITMFHAWNYRQESERICTLESGPGHFCSRYSVESSAHILSRNKSDQKRSGEN